MLVCPTVLTASVCICLQVVKGPVTKHLPATARRIGFSVRAEKLVTLKQYVAQLPETEIPVFVVGAMAHGSIDVTYCDQMVSISQYPLSAACCLNRITGALEDKWQIV